MFPTDTLDLTVEENIGDGSKIMQLTAMDADEVAHVFRICNYSDLGDLKCMLGALVCNDKDYEFCILPQRASVF